MKRHYHAAWPVSPGRTVTRTRSWSRRATILRKDERRWVRLTGKRMMRRAGREEGAGHHRIDKGWRDGSWSRMEWSSCRTAPSFVWGWKVHSAMVMPSTALRSCSFLSWAPPARSVTLPLTALIWPSLPRLAAKKKTTDMLLARILGIVLGGKGGGW